MYVATDVTKVLRVWASVHAEFGYLLSEAALLHRMGNTVEQASARTGFRGVICRKSRAMMAAWGRFSPPWNVQNLLGLAELS